MAAFFPRRFLPIAVLALALPVARGDEHPASPAPQPPSIQWQGWSLSLFETAQLQNKFVLLNLRAGWSPACQAMDARTYADARTIEAVGSHYIAVSVDQDARPDFAAHYQDGGWPATVVFAPDGTEVARRNGFLSAKALGELLQRIDDDPAAGATAQPEQAIHPANTERLNDELRKKLRETLFAGYDSKQGGWGRGCKSVDFENVEYCLTQAKAGDSDAGRMARQTLDSALRLMDPVWGGLYQCSDKNDWEHPQFEKTMRVQAQALRLYAQAYLLWGDPAYLKAAREIHHYVRTFLTSPDGVVYNSQDGTGPAGMDPASYFKLDDERRRKAGVPRVDTRVFARENGWFISALCELYSATGEAPFLAEAGRAGQWMIDFRGIISDGGFRHQLANDAGPYLGDTVAMGQALLDLYSVSAQITWRWYASQAADAVSNRYGCDAGFIDADPGDSRSFKPMAQFDENVDFARFANLLFQYVGAKTLPPLVETAMKFVGAPELSEARGAHVGGLLLADSETGAKPLCIMVIGSKEDAEARKLFAAALRYPCDYRQTEWWDHAEKGDARWPALFPNIPGPAAFVVANATRSAPAATVDELAARIQELTRKQE